MPCEPIIPLPDLVKIITEGFERDIPKYRPEDFRAAIWTNSVKKSLRLAGRDRGEQVLCTDNESQSREFLLDVIWRNLDTNRPDLGIECEWGNPGRVAEDFKRLLWFKTNLKVMICNPQTRTGRDLDPLPAILDELRRYPDHAAGEYYGVINVFGTPKGGDARAYHWCAESPGKHPEAELSELRESPFPYRFRPPDQALAATES